MEETSFNELGAMSGLLISSLSIFYTSLYGDDSMTYIASTLTDSIGAFASMSLISKRKNFCVAMNSARVVSAIFSVMVSISLSEISIATSLQIVQLIIAFCALVQSLYYWLNTKNGYVFSLDDIFACAYTFLWTATIFEIMADGGCHRRPMLSISITGSLGIACVSMMIISRRNDDMVSHTIEDLIHKMWNSVITKFSRDDAFCVVTRPESVLFSLACFLMAITKFFVIIIIPTIGSKMCSASNRAECSWAPLTIVLFVLLLILGSLFEFMRCALATNTKHRYS